MLDKHIPLPKKIFTYVILIFFGFILFAPFLYMISIALASKQTNALQTFTLIPREFNLSNFQELFSNLFSGNRPMGKWFLNTMFVVLMSIIGQLFSTSFVAYGFARMRYKHKNAFFLILLGTMMLPTDHSDSGIYYFP